MGKATPCRELTDYSAGPGKHNRKWGQKCLGVKVSILRLDVPISASCISGGLKHSTLSDHGIVSKIATHADWAALYHRVTFLKLLRKSVQILHLAAFRTEKVSISQRLRDGGFERIKFLLFLNAKSGINCFNRLKFINMAMNSNSFTQSLAP
jgi:hypothetical protein